MIQPTSSAPRRPTLPEIIEFISKRHTDSVMIGKIFEFMTQKNDSAFRVIQNFNNLAPFGMLRLPLDLLEKMYNSTCVIFGRTTSYFNYLFSLDKSNKCFKAHVLSDDGSLGKIFEGQDTKFARAQIVMKRLFPELNQDDANYLSFFIDEIRKLPENQLILTCKNLAIVLHRLNQDEDDTIIPLIEYFNQEQERFPDVNMLFDKMLIAAGLEDPVNLLNCKFLDQSTRYINYLFAHDDEEHFQRYILSESRDLGCLFGANDTKQARAQMIMKMLFPELDENNPDYLGVFMTEIFKLPEDQLIKTCSNIISVLHRINQVEDGTTIPLIEFLKEKQGFPVVNFELPLFNGLQPLYLLSHFFSSHDVDTTAFGLLKTLFHFFNERSEKKPILKDFSHFLLREFHKLNLNNIIDKANELEQITLDDINNEAVISLESTAAWWDQPPLNWLQHLDSFIGTCWTLNRTDLEMERYNDRKPSWFNQFKKLWDRNQKDGHWKIFPPGDPRLHAFFNSPCYLLGKKTRYINLIFSSPFLFEYHFLSNAGGLGDIFQNPAYATKQACAQLIMGMLFPELDENASNYLDLFINEIRRSRGFGAHRDLGAQTLISVFSLLYRLNAKEDGTTIPLIECLKQKQKLFFNNDPNREITPLNYLPDEYGLLMTLDKSYVGNNEGQGYGIFGMLSERFGRLLLQKTSEFRGDEKTGKALIGSIIQLLSRSTIFDLRFHPFFLRQLNCKMLLQNPPHMKHVCINWLTAPFPSNHIQKKSTLHHLLADPKLSLQFFGFPDSSQRDPVDFFNDIPRLGFYHIQFEVLKPFVEKKESTRGNRADRFWHEGDRGLLLESFFRQLTKNHHGVSETLAYFLYLFEPADSTHLSRFLRCPLGELDESGNPSRKVLSFKEFQDYFLTWSSQEFTGEDPHLNDFSFDSEEAQGVLRLFENRGQTTLTKRAQKSSDLEPNAKKAKTANEEL